MPNDEENLMADTVKKPAAPRKPRAVQPKAEAAAPAASKPAAKKSAAVKATAKSKVTPIRAASKVSRDEIAALAHRFWLERGGEHGHDAEDWLRAEQTLRGKAS